MVGASFTVAAVAQVLRAKKGIQAVGNAQVSTAQSQFGGSSALFDASADWLVITNTDDLNTGTGDFTLEFWMRPISRATNFPVVIQNRAFQAGCIQITDRHNYNTSKLQVWVVNYSNADPMFLSTTTIANNTWYHIAVSRSGSSWRLFVNGTQEGSTVTYSGDATVGANNFAAIGNDATNTAVTQWNGYIDEVRWSNTARYTANFTPSTTPFVNDANTLFLMHANGTNASTFFEDDNGVRAPKGISALGNAQVDTAQSKFGGASALFDGTGDYLFSPSNTDFGFGTGDFTLEGWFRFSNFTNGPALFDMRSAGGTEVKPLIYCGSDGRLYYYVNGSARITGNILSTNTWYHISVSRSGTNTKMFQDGTQVGSTYTDTNNYGTTVVSIGIASWNTAFNALNGHADEIRISNTARYTANFTAPTAPFVNDANTVLLLHMDGTDAATVFRDDNGALANRQPKSITAVGNAQVSTAQSKFGGASYLGDGTGDRLNVIGEVLDSQYTIEYWFRASSFSNGPTLVDFRGGGGGAANYSDYITSGGVFTVFVNNGNRIQSSALSTNTWYHIAVVRESNSDIKLYVNGTKTGDTYNYGGYHSNTTWYIGDNYVFNNSFNGYLDEVRVSNTARYTTNFSVATAPFQNDANTVLLIHADGANASTQFFDDTANRTQKGISAIGNAQVDTAQSKFGGSSALFDGTGDWLKSDFYPEFNFQGDFTIEGWFRLTANEGAYTSTITHAWGITGGLSGWYFSTNAYNGTQKLGFSFVTNSGSKIELNYGSTLPLNTWMHLAVCRDGNKLYFYKDGVLLNSGGYTLTEGLRGFAGNYDFGIGASPFDNSGAFNGWMDEIRISNSARYPAGTTFTPSTTPFQNDANTLLLLHMDGTDASTAFFDDNGIAPYTP
jgi:hypothetical protein